MNFDLHIGIDYSGRKTPTSRTPALQVYAEALQGVLQLAEDEALSDDAEATGDEEQFEIDRTAGFSV